MLRFYTVIVIHLFFYCLYSMRMPIIVVFYFEWIFCVTLLRASLLCSSYTIYCFFENRFFSCEYDLMCDLIDRFESDHNKHITSLERSAVDWRSTTMEEAGRRRLAREKKNDVLITFDKTRQVWFRQSYSEYNPRARSFRLPSLFSRNRNARWFTKCSAPFTTRVSTDTGPPAVAAAHERIARRRWANSTVINGGDRTTHAANGIIIIIIIT